MIRKPGRFWSRLMTSDQLRPDEIEYEREDLSAGSIVGFLAGLAIIGLLLHIIVLGMRSEEHTSELQSHSDLVCRLLLEKKNEPTYQIDIHNASIARLHAHTPPPTHRQARD